MGDRKAVEDDRKHGLLRVGVYLLSLCLALTAVRETIAQVPPASCAPALARVVSLQGNVEVQRADSEAWTPLTRLDMTLCAGDQLRTAALSRAALFVQPESVVRVDQNTVITLRQSADEIAVEFLGAELAAKALNENSCGAGYFITRFPRKFKVTTPHMNAAVEGTEFMVESSCDATQLTVLEGKVASESVATQDSQMITAGQSLASGAAGSEAITAVVKPLDSVQWVLRYPPISDLSDTNGVSVAETLLRAGSVDEALRAIDSTLAANPSSSDAHALRSVIQIAKNDKSSALEAARKATELDATNYRGWLALSYAQQAVFDLDAALESALSAELRRPDSGLAHARVAELLLSQGLVGLAEEAARAAVAAEPTESYAHSILGFVHLAQIEIATARLDFTAAIERDSFNAFPRFGLGLAKIRNGELVPGREELEIAVALDPSNSLLRSYIAKAYYEENTPERDQLAATQFDLAGTLDPSDPTPNFYDAILAQSQNRPIEALDLLKSATAKNDNRAVYRSRLLIEDDAAAQGAAVTAIYRDLRFERLGILESTKALSENPGNPAAHRALASAYANIPRHDIARVSEALQAQIRQPVSIAPVPPLLGTDSLLLPRDLGPSQIGLNEFSQLFNSNDIEWAVEGIGGSRDTNGGQVVMSGLENRVGFSLGALNYQTDGFVANDSAERELYDAFVQWQLQSGSSLQFDLKRSEIGVGQTFFAFEPLFAEATTISEQSDSFRLNAHQSGNPRFDWIETVVFEDRRREVFSFPDPFLLTGNDASTIAVEMQNLLHAGQWQIVSGTGYVEEEDDFTSGADVSISAANLYSYGHWQSKSGELMLDVGLSLDSFQLENSFFTEQIDIDRVNPRLGMVWSPTATTAVRAAAASTLKRPLVRAQTIEPTQVASFNQYFTGFERFYGDPDGTVSKRIGVALDHAFSLHRFAGIELSKRELEVAQFEGTFDWDEESALAYLYVAFSKGAWQGAVSLDAEFEKIDRPPEFTGAEGILDLETVRAPIGVRLFSNRGFAMGLALTYVSQKGRFAAFPGDPIVVKDDEGLLVDASLEYSLPRRAGTIIVGISNIFDEFVDLLEIDPLNPRVSTRQLAFLKFSAEF
jgi:Tfp pilus assembly protein PilF